MTFEDVAKKALEFRGERDWAQFHNPERPGDIDQP